MAFHLLNLLDIQQFLETVITQNYCQNCFQKIGLVMVIKQIVIKHFL